MENLEIDQNTRNTGGGSIYGTSLTFPLCINPSTGELLVEIHPVNTDGTAIAPRNLNIDENHRNIGGAITNDTNKFITPLTVATHIDLPCLRIET